MTRPKYREIIDPRLLAGGLILLTTVGVHSQQKTSREIDGLIGPVHKVVTVHTAFVRTGDKWVEDGETTTSVRTYDEKENGGRSRDGGSESANGRGGGTVKHNDKGQVVERAFYGPDNELAGKILFTHDQAGRVIEVVEQNGKGNLRRRHEQTFDDRGNMTSLSTFGSDNKINRKLTWTFDTKGNRTEWTEQLLKGDELTLFQRITSTYDDKNNVLVETQYGNPEGSVMRQVFSYEFDARGNWIKRERLLLAGDSNEAQRRDLDLRSITYYEN
ncbi:MAG: hypothetical protein WAQ99_15845 [Pyrinomonadaceae bacterium]